MLEINNVGSYSESQQVKTQPNTYCEKKQNVNRDSFEKSTNSIYETYGDFSKKKDCEISKIQVAVSCERYHNSFHGLKGYYRGEVSAEKIKSDMKQQCMKLMEYEQWKGSSSDSNEILDKIVGEVCSLYKFNAVQVGVLYCDEKGDEINSQYTCSTLRDYAYYDSKAYYDCEEITNHINEFASDIYKELSGEDKDFTERHDKPYIKLDFNTIWNATFTNNVRTSKLLNTAVKPPKNFSFFFKSSPYNDSTNLEQATIGNIQIWTEKDHVNLDVPFTPARAGVKGLPGMVFHVDELLEHLNCKLDNDIHSFLKNILIFKQEYGFSYQNRLRQI